VLSIFRGALTDEQIFREVERMYRDPRASAIGFRRIDDTDLPTDRTYRDAWADTGAGPLTHDMPRARGLHLARVRLARAKRFAELDSEWMRAAGQGKKADEAAVEARRQALRDLPATLGVEAATTVEDLKACWSPLLEGS